MSVNTKVNGQLVPSAGLYSVTKPIGMADIYSTEEKEVGLWIDNKPLYAKTINFGALPNSTTKEVAHGISNLDTIANVYGVAKSQYNQIPIPWANNTNTTYDIAMYVDDTNVAVMTSIDRSGYTSSMVTVFYTKTTDTPWSGKFVPQGYGYVSSGDIYSFEERQVGVWTDGKPLYQKTIYLQSIDITTSSSGMYYYAITTANYISNAELILGKTEMSYVITGGETRILEDVEQQGALTVLWSKISRPSVDAVVTLQYTKTTDVAGSGEYVPSGDKAEHYSTDEQVIGTWLGETLYRKVFANTGTTITCGANTWTTIPFASVPNLSRIIDASVYDENGTKFVGCIASSNNALSFYNVRTVGVNLNNGSQVILEYTKTS